MQELGLNTSYLQQDDQHETGTAAVTIDGRPAEFHHQGTGLVGLPAMDDGVGRLVSRADVICFGSLAQRSPSSAVTIDAFCETPQKPCAYVM